MSLDGDQGLLPGGTAGLPERNGASPRSAQDPKAAAKKQDRPKNDVKKSASSLELPNGCSLSGEVDIPVERLVVTPRRDEGDKGAVRLQNLAESLKVVGQLYPAIVRLDPVTMKYLVLAGNRRTAAAKLAGIPAVRCRIFQGPDAAIPHVISAVENAHREQEGPWSLAQKLAAALKEGFDQKRLAEMFQKSKGAVSDMLYAVTKLPAAYRRRIEKGENLYKVVSEHRQAKKQSAAIVPTEVTPKDQITQDGSGTPTPSGTSQSPQAAEPSVVQPPVKPTTKPAASYQYGRYEYGGLTIRITGTSKEQAPDADMTAALRFVLGMFEAKLRGEPG